MLSKRQAEAASKALLESGRYQRDKHSPLLARFPELAAISFDERKAMVKAASKAVWKSWPMLVALGAVVVLAAGWAWAAIVRPDVAGDLWWAPFLAAFTAYQVSQSLVRRDLRRVLAHQRLHGR